VEYIKDFDNWNLTYSML